MKNIYPKCALCGGIPSNGLYDGFRLNGKFVCSICEAHILFDEIASSEYRRNIMNIRAMLYG